MGQDKKNILHEIFFLQKKIINNILNVQTWRYKYTVWSATQKNAPKYNIYLFIIIKSQEINRLSVGFILKHSTKTGSKFHKQYIYKKKHMKHWIKHDIFK